MRLISQNGMIDVPYDSGSLAIGTGRYQGVEFAKIYYYDNSTQTGRELAEYKSKAKAQKAMDMLRTAYTGIFVTNADIPDDFNEQLKELMKGGFGTVIVKDTNDSRVEFDNLNGYFQFPQDEYVEV